MIIGGGIHGVHLAVRLLGEAGVDPQRLTIIDPASSLLDTWRRCTSNTGMSHLRSPGVHHLDVEPYALFQFAGSSRARFARPKNRPELQLFTEHCDHVLSTYGLAERHLRDRATAVDLGCESVRVHLQGGDTLESRNVVLALGASELPRWPMWARRLVARSAKVHHVFDPGFVFEPKQWPGRVAVVGGGITAAQVALRLADAGRDVHMVSRHAPRVHQFDSPSGWMGPKYLRGYAKVTDLDERRRLITGARHAGSMPPEVHKALRRAVARGKVHMHLGDVERAMGESPIGLMLGERTLFVDSVILSTGFEAQRPGGRLVDQLVADHQLPCATCGYPAVDTHLRWHPRLFVTGPLAELEVGPVARNIAGARHAGTRILAANA